MSSKSYLPILLGVVATTGCSRIDELWAGAQSEPAVAEAGVSSTAHNEGAGRRARARRETTAAANARTVSGMVTRTTDPPRTPGEPPTEPGLDLKPDASVAMAANATDASAVAAAVADAGPALDDTGPVMSALWIWVPIFAQMDSRGSRLGYLRAGAQVHVSAQPTGTEGCPRGWYSVHGGGYLCLNRMTTLDPNDMRRAPAQPDLTQAMPYPYMTAYRAAVMYRWLPSAADMREIEPERFGITPPGALAAIDGGVTIGSTSESTAAGVTPAVLSTTAPVTGGQSAGTPQNSEDAGTPVRNAAAATVTNRAQANDAGVRIEDLAGQAGSPLLRRMLSGMYISVDRAATSAGRGFWRTQNGGWVERNAVSPLHNAPTFQGVLIDEQHPLPLAFMTAYAGWTYNVSADNRTVSRRERAPRLTPYQLTADPPVTVGRMQYYRTTDGFYVSDRNVRVVRTQAPAADIGPDEKWVEVNLDRQTMIAYQGARPVYVTLVSTGRRNTTDAERNYETIQGSFRIQSKHIATTMDGNSAGDGPYSIEDVPWVMYFENSFALHGAFWHTAFGFMHSHGCVNMAPADARWLFNWTEPALPPGWHGVYTDPSHRGTRVFVHYERQPLGERGGPTTVPQH